MDRLLAKVVVLNVGLLLAGYVNAAPIATKRAVFGESPAAIARYFGPYWSRLTTKLPNGKTEVTYRYNPAKVRRIFPESSKLGLYITFVDNRATAIKVHAHGDLMQHYQDRSDRLFTYLFGQASGKEWMENKQILQDSAANSGTLQVTQFCLAQGISTRHEWVSVPDFTLEATIEPNARCQLQPGSSK